MDLNDPQPDAKTGRTASRTPKRTGWKLLAALYTLITLWIAYGAVVALIHGALKGDIMLDYAITFICYLSLIGYAFSRRFFCRIFWKIVTPAVVAYGVWDFFTPDNIDPINNPGVTSTLWTDLFAGFFLFLLYWAMLRYAYAKCGPWEE